MPKNKIKTTDTINLEENIQEQYINEPEKDLFCIYFFKEKEYLMSKYKDLYVWQIYLYFLENKNLPQFFKTNKQILKELHNSMSEHKLIECKKILVDEKILVEVKNSNGKVKTYQFSKLELSIEVKPR